MTDKTVCLTFEAALEKAIQMEEEGFRNYLRAIRTVRDAAAKDILKEAAIDELGHKHQLEKALVVGAVDRERMERPMPTMNLDYILQKRELGPNATARDALAYAIHMEKEATQFYRELAGFCEGAPMGDLFTLLGNDETRHLQALEDMYEEHFLTEN